MNICQVLLLDYFSPSILIQRILIRIQQLFLMSGESSPTPLFVTWQHEQFAITLRLPPGEDFLQARVQDSNTLQVYDQRVDDQFIAENDGLNGFANFYEVYRYFVEHLSRVVFEDESIKLRGERPIAIGVRLQGRDWTKLAHSRIGNLRADVEARLLEKETKIEELMKWQEEGKKQMELISQRLEEVTQRFDTQLTRQGQELDAANRNIETQRQGLNTANQNIANLRRDLDTANRTIATQRQEIDAANRNIATFRQELTTANNNIAALRRDLTTANDTIEGLRYHVTTALHSLTAMSVDLAMAKNNIVIHRRQLDDLNRRVSNLQSKKRDIFHHPQNNHAQNFILTRLGTNSMRMICRGSGWQNFMNGMGVSAQQKVTYNVKISSGIAVFMGFCTSAGLGNANNFSHSQSVYYYGGGELWRGGNRVISNAPVSVVGNWISCESDLPAGVIRWWRGGSVLVQAIIPQAMKGKPIFFSVIMSDVNHQVQLTF